MFGEIERRLSLPTSEGVRSYAEPYAGGAGAAIRLLAEGAVEKLYLNDFDWRVYAAWSAMLDEPELFIERIKNVPLCVDEWRRQREIVENEKRDEANLFDVGFATFFLNRTNRSGIIVGAGPIGGYDQTGKWKIDARFSREALASRVQWLSSKRDQIILSNEDGLRFVKRQAELSGEETLFFIDPPYVGAGSRLYFNGMTELRHLDLAKFLIGNTKVPHWIVTYDDDPLIRTAYSKVSVEPLDVRYTLQSKRKAGELLITPLG